MMTLSMSRGLYRTLPSRILWSFQNTVHGVERSRPVIPGVAATSDRGKQDIKK